MIRYIPVALLYAIYNNLMFLNLRANHPSMYLLLCSSRLLMTAIVWQTHFQVKISSIRKGALVFITLGICLSKGMMKEEVTGDTIDNVDDDTSSLSPSTFSGTILILFQMSCSVMAGVYNEKLLKNDKFDQNLQNICMYLNSIVINLLIGSLSSATTTTTTSEGGLIDILSEMRRLFKPISMLTVLLLAGAGIMSSMVLRYENSVTKGVASACETVLASLIEFFCYGHVFGISELFGIVLVSIGTILYSFSPSETISISSIQKFCAEKSGRRKAARISGPISVDNLVCNDCTKLFIFHGDEKYSRQRGKMILLVSNSRIFFFFFLTACAHSSPVNQPVN